MTPSRRDNEQPTVFCVDCKHSKERHGFLLYCGAHLYPLRVSPVTGPAPRPEPYRCEDVRAGYRREGNPDCPHFIPLGPRVSWWRRLLRWAS